MTTNKKNDGELFSLIAITVLFGGGMIGVDLWYSDWKYMGGWSILAAISNAATIIAAFIMFKEWRDPDFNKVRGYFCALAFITMLFIGFFKATSKEDKQVIIDSHSSVFPTNGAFYI